MIGRLSRHLRELSSLCRANARRSQEEDIEGEDLAAWLVRCINQPSRSAFSVYFMGRTVTMPDGTHKPLMGITAMIWWN